MFSDQFQGEKTTTTKGFEFYITASKFPIYIYAQVIKATAAWQTTTILHATYIFVQTDKSKTLQLSLKFHYIYSKSCGLEGENVIC